MNINKEGLNFLPPRITKRITQEAGKFRGRTSIGKNGRLNVSGELDYYIKVKEIINEEKIARNKKFIKGSVKR